MVRYCFVAAVAAALAGCAVPRPVVVRVRVAYLAPTPIYADVTVRFEDHTDGETKAEG